MATPVKDGILEIALSNAVFFTNAAQDDFIVRTATSNQNMLLGTLSNAPAALVLSSNNNTLVTQRLGVNTTSPQYTVDVNGNINFTGNLTANGARLFSQNMSLNSNTINTFAVLPARQSFLVTNSNQSVFDVLGGGTYVATALSTEVYLNGSRLSYISSNLQDYDLTVSYPNGYSTNYRVTLTTPASYNDVVDIQVWPGTPASNVLTGIYCSNVDFTSNVTTGSLTVSSNIIAQGAITTGNAFYANGFFVQLTNSNAVTQSAISAVVPNLTSTGTGTTVVLPAATSNTAFRVTASSNTPLCVRGDGNVGINISNPTLPLHVVGDARIQGNLTVNGTQTVIDTNVATTERLDITNDGTGPALRVTQLGAQPIADFYDDGNVLTMRIADGGNVGIGTSNPGSRLAVGGNVTVGAAYSNMAAPANGLIVQGNIGFGHSNPQSKLHIVMGSTQAPATSGYMNTGVLLERGNGGQCMNMGCADTYNWIHSAYSDNSGVTLPLTLQPVGGNVGIGTSNPQAKLDVNGYIKASHPAFMATKTNGGVSGTTIILWNNVLLNSGGCYNATNGRFTAPVRGIYTFSCQAMKGATTGHLYLYVTKNGSTVISVGHSGNSVYDHTSAHITIELQLNDYIYVEHRGDDMYGNASGVEINGYNSFSGHLIFAL